MPKSIPEGLTREHIILAIKDLDEGIEHGFKKPIHYELVHNGKRYSVLLLQPGGILLDYQLAYVALQHIEASLHLSYKLIAEQCCASWIFAEQVLRASLRVCRYIPWHLATA